MATADVDICNIALRHLAISTTIGSLTEKSKEAKACNDLYAQTRDEVLEDFPWPFCTVLDNLVLSTVAVPSEWTYAYQYPSCIGFRRILSGTRNDTRQSRIPYRIVTTALGGKYILTDMPNAQGEWTLHITDPSQFSPAFVQATALKLAGYIGPTVAGGDQFKLADRALARYEYAIGQARANALNEQQPDEDPDAEHIRARDGTPFPTTIFGLPL
jgi:hypothetical protein